MWDVILDALIDSSIAAPFLLAIYLLIEWLESNRKAKLATVRLLNGKVAPLVAGGVGLIPQCGFSVMATDLYCQNYLKTGTLIAFFVATSDEALPILLTNKSTIGVTWVVLVVKIVYAVALGFLINLFDKRNLYVINDDVTMVADEREPHDHSHSEEHEHFADNVTEKQGESAAESGSTVLHVSEGCCHHGMTRGKGFWNFVKHPLLHTLKIFVYIFVVNAVFGLLLYYFEKPVTDFTSKLGFAQSFITALIGLVPNCASSVIITGMYAEGIIDLSALLAGLISNSGIALAILFKDRKHIKRSLVILAVMYFAGVVVGIPTYFIMQLI